MKIYHTKSGTLLEKDGRFFRLDDTPDALFNRNDLYGYLESVNTAETQLDDAAILPPVGTQEIWAAGVTYLKSRDARMEESQSSGGADLYDKVYDAARPELFFKSTPAKAVGQGAEVYIRRDSEWNVPEPELTLLINSNGQIVGYTIGNDVSSRSIEGENALYLPQAKVYDRSASVGPCVLITKNFDPESTISLVIRRGSEVMYEDSTPVSRMKRSLDELAGYLYRESSFPTGVFLMTGTCLVPPSSFTLQPGDEVEISITGIGTLRNIVAYNPNSKY